MSTKTQAVEGPIYICGPMTGIKDYNYPAFNAAAKRLRGLGYKVENPAEIELPEGKVQGDMKWEWYIQRAIATLLKCKTVAVLAGWSESTGASVEHSIAREVGIVTIWANDIGPRAEAAKTPPALVSGEMFTQAVKVLTERLDGIPMIPDNLWDRLYALEKHVHELEDRLSPPEQRAAAKAPPAIPSREATAHGY